MSMWFRKKVAVLLCLIFVMNLSASCSLSGTDTPDDGRTVLKLALREGIYSDVIEKSVEQFEKEANV